jgi:signal transduction histidine kinase
VTTPADLASRRVVVGRIAEKLADVAARVNLGGTHHCVVLDDAGQRFVGLIQFADVVGRSQAGNRILGDLVSSVQPIRVRPHDTAAQVATLFERHELTEAVLVDGDDHYLGLITAQSVLEWSRQEYLRSQTDLAAALDRVRQASQAKDHFIAAVSHELRTPLTPVLLVASAGAADPSLSPELQRHFQMIAEHVTHEAQLVDELLEQGALLRGDLTLERELLDVHAVLRELVEQSRLSLSSKEIRFTFELAAFEPQVEGDRVRLAHVFSELLANAIRFTPARGQVRVTTAVEPGGAYLAIRFADSGVGFSAADMARMFEPFAELARRPGELGLGLSIARGLVEMHAGQLRVESAGQDQGATFVVRLPLRSDSLPRSDSLTAESSRVPNVLPGRSSAESSPPGPSESNFLAS